MTLDQFECPDCGTHNHTGAAHCTTCGRDFPALSSTEGASLPAGAPASTVSPSGYVTPPGPSPFGSPAQPPYATCAPPVYAQSSSKADTCAILSAVFGGISLVFMCLGAWSFGFPAIVLGWVSLVRQKKDPLLTGRPLAVTGIVLGAIPLLIVFAGFTIFALITRGVSK